MVSIHVERTIAGPPDEVFGWMTNSHNYTAAPLCLREKRTRDGRGAPYGVGAIREVLGLGAWFQERITGYDPPHSFEYLIVKSVPKVRHDGGVVRIQRVGDGSHVSWDTSYTVPWWSGGKVSEKVLTPRLRFSFVGILKACDETVTSEL